MIIPTPMIAITPAEAKIISVALRYQANDMQSNILARHERVIINNLLALANQIDERVFPAQPPETQPNEYRS